MITIKEQFALLIVTLLVLPIHCVFSNSDYCLLDCKDLNLELDVDFDCDNFERRYPNRLLPNQNNLLD